MGEIIQKNFRLNSLANQYAAALHNHITATSGGEFFTLDIGGEALHVNIVDGVRGIRELVDGYLLEALQLNYSNWEAVGTGLLSKCSNGDELTPLGLDMWRSLCGDMASTIENQGGGFNA